MVNEPSNNTMLLQDNAKSWEQLAQQSAPGLASTPATTPSPAKGDDTAPTGVENVRYDVVTSQGAPDNPKTAQEAVTQQLTAKPSAVDKTDVEKVNNNEELIALLQKRMDSHKPLTEEELKKLRRRQKAEGIISSIADASQAIANLFFTTQYAPNMYNGKEGMAARARERFDRAKAEREADDEKYLNYALKIGSLRAADRDAERRDQQTNISLQLKMNEDARRQAKAEHDAELADIDLQIKMGKLGYEEARAAKTRADQKLAEAYAAHADELVMSKINANNRAHTGSGGSSPKSQYYVKRVNPTTGKTEYKSGFTSEAAARNYAATYSSEGWVYSTTPTTRTNSSTTTTTDPYAGKKTSERITTSTTDVSSPKVEIEWK